MAEEEKKVEITEEEEKKAEVTEENEPKEEKKEKKENAFSKLWNKTKKSINDSLLESKITSAYEKELPEFKVYEKDALMASGLKGKLEGDKLTYIGEKKYALNSVVVAGDDTAYYLVAIEDTTVKATVEEVEYERPGVTITLDKNVEEVNVIKAGKRYFLYKGEEK